MKDVPIEQRWQEAHTRPIETKWIDINKGDGDRVEIRSRHVATQLKMHPVKVGILPDDVSSATPPLEADLMLMTENKQSKKYKLMLVDLSRANFHSPARRRVFLKLLPERARQGMCAFAAARETQQRTLQQSSWTR